MSRIKSEQPQRLPEKLKQIRSSLDLNHVGMFEALRKQLKDGVKLHSGYISRYEAGSRVPSLLVLLAYSRVAKISLENIIDDDRNLSD